MKLTNAIREKIAKGLRERYVEPKVNSVRRELIEAVEGVLRQDRRLEFPPELLEYVRYTNEIRLMRDDQKMRFMLVVLKVWESFPRKSNEQTYIDIGVVEEVPKLNPIVGRYLGVVSWEWEKRKGIEKMLKSFSSTGKLVERFPWMSGVVEKATKPDADSEVMKEIEDLVQ